MKNILLIGNHPPPYGGVPVHVEQLALYLAERGWQVVVLSLMSQAPKDLPEVEKRHGYVIYRPRFIHKLMAMFVPIGFMLLPFQALSFLRVSLITYLSHIAICFYARTIANRHEIKVVSAYHILSAGLIGAWLKKNLGIPLVTTIFGEVYREEQLYRKLEKLVKLAVS